MSIRSPPFFSSQTPGPLLEIREYIRLPLSVDGTWKNLREYLENMKEYEEIRGKHEENIKEYDGICRKYEVI